ncbi:hypothetical protein DSO57_1017698 [Entomophthora muscae]|uniref:Uncharacterized protein n=1 Tax=Entomophthora muscae TaxID=34485 RepID=A0ACC2U315_9FUNG|nr:hypothetical protein DSO57_1017698 [Entomophthora muscae]
MVIFEPTPDPFNPRDSFLVEGGMPCGNNNTYQDLPSGPAQQQQFMDDIPWPSPLGNQSPLLLTAPAPMEVDAYVSPSKIAIQQSMTRMDKGEDNKGQQSQMLTIQHPFAEISMDRFYNISVMNLNQLCKDFQTAEHVKDYIQHFAHPAICHNQVNLGCPQSLIQDQGILVINQQSFLWLLYHNLTTNFELINNQLSEVVTVQNSIIPWSKAVERGLNSLVPHQVIQTLCHQGLDSNWIVTVAAYIKENRPVICELVQEVIILSQRLSALPMAGPSQPVIYTPSPSSTMMNRDILELYDHLSELQHEVKEVVIDLTFIY